ncbi:MAG: hypothetical protein ACFFHD_14225 [Promethearchaeota archaeon]
MKSNSVKTLRSITEYSTLDLVKDLKKELQQFSEQLALLFPERIWKFKHQHLSILWEKSENYISRVISKIKNINNNFRFPDNKDGLEKLENIILCKFKLKGKNCISLIDDYRNNKISTLEFISLIETELGRISGDIIVNDYELGLMLKGHNKYFERLKSRINNPNDSDYNPQFKFSREGLNKFKDTLNLFLGNQSEKCIKYILKYEKLNQDLKDYSNQQYNLKNSHAFINSEILDTFYWLGFLYADAYISKKYYRVDFEISSNDSERVDAFAQFIGLDSKYIHDRERILFHNGVPILYNMTFVRPVCKPMVTDLCNLGYCLKKASRKNLPKFVIDLITEAKHKNWRNWQISQEGKKATTWLLGFYDGDGSYYGFHTARIRSVSKNLLKQIKNYFDIPNQIRTVIEPDTECLIFDYKILLKGYYQLNLGGLLFRSMLQNYKKSMVRKRPLNE